MVDYEWDVESVCLEDTAEYEKGEILQHYHCGSYLEALKIFNEEPIEGCEHKIVLVRDDDEGRSWAYIVDWKLPEVFLCAYGRWQADVPKRFHKEVEKASKCKP